MSVELLSSKTLIEYEDALNLMESRINDVINGLQDELIWLLEHPALLTEGVSAKNEDLLSNTLPVFKTNRGGKFTLHSPGQRVCYLLLDLKKRSKNRVPDPKKFIKDLEDVIIASLAKIGIKGEIREDRVGVWVKRENNKEEKIAAIGVKFKKGVTMHGFAINVKNDLDLFKAIVPCGIKDYGICSIKSLGIEIEMAEFDKILITELTNHFLKEPIYN